MACPRCNESAPDGASFCRRCGTALAPGSEAAPITVGREADSTLQINSPRVSSRHASLTPQPDGRFLLRDLGSSNGVFVGSPDNRVKSALVGPDDVVYFADRSFRVAEIVAGLHSGGWGGGPARLRIGREADNDVVIKDESVSRHHAVLERDGRSLWWLEDLGSNNGTRVNGRPVIRQTVSAADAVTFGRYETQAGVLMDKAPSARPGPRAGSRPPVSRRVGGRPGKRSSLLPYVLLGVLVALLAAGALIFLEYNPTTGPAAVTELVPKSLQSRPESDPGTASEGLSVHDLSEQATVFILVPRGKGLSLGTGFFIADGLVVTNRHVVGGKGNEALITNKTLGRILKARVVASALAERDYAVLSTESVDSIIPLKFNLKVKRGDRVGTWGYPSFVIEGDPKLQALFVEGDLSVAPEVVFTSGEVSAIHETEPPRIIHTAVISQGNSGGPLVNEQGEVLGINTLLKIDNPGQSNRQSNY